MCDLGTGQVEAARLLQRTVEFPVLMPASTAGRPHSHAFMVADDVDHATRWGPARVR